MPVVGLRSPAHRSGTRMCGQARAHIHTASDSRGLRDGMALPSARSPSLDKQEEELEPESLTLCQRAKQEQESEMGNRGQQRGQSLFPEHTRESCGNAMHRTSMGRRCLLDEAQAESWFPALTLFPPAAVQHF